MATCSVARGSAKKAAQMCDSLIFSLSEEFSGQIHRSAQVVLVDGRKSPSVSPRSSPQDVNRIHVAVFDATEKSPFMGAARLNDHLIALCYLTLNVTRVSPPAV